MKSGAASITGARSKFLRCNHEAPQTLSIQEKDKMAAAMEVDETPAKAEKARWNRMAGKLRKKDRWRVARYVTCPLLGHRWAWRGRSRSGKRCWVCPRCQGQYETSSQYLYPRRHMRAFYGERVKHGE